MPRRAFFRSASERKSTRKNQAEQKQQQQLKHRKEQKFRQQQIQHGQVDRLQGSSSTHGSADPPLNLNEPARNVPKKSHGDPSRASQNQDLYYSSRDANDNYGQHHSQGQAYEVEPNAGKNVVQEAVQIGPIQMHQQHTDGQLGHNQMQQEYGQIGQEQMRQHYGHIVQEQIGHEENHTSSQPEHQNPSTLAHEGNMKQGDMVPTVESATDKMWQCATGDFRSGSLAIQLLRLAVVTDWELRQQRANGDIDQLMTFPYDPSETFLSLQGAALRFHANFDLMRAERDSCSGEGEGPDSLEWELTEQTAWEVWEESLRASAALAHAVVSPGWQYQLQMRRQLNHEDELRSIYGSTLQRNHDFDDYSEGGSSLGSYSFDMSNPQSSHFSERPRPVADLIMPNILDKFRVVIPEVLPAAMIRFAASVTDCTPTLLEAQSKIAWKEGQTQQQMQSVILNNINEQRRWIRRLKRLGDAQRDMTFALFCVPSQDANDAQEDDNEWSIPRTHIPMATMICSWLTCCAVGWPMPRNFDLVPCHYQQVSVVHPSSDDPEIQEEVPNPPPSEIILPVHQSSSSPVRSNDNSDTMTGEQADSAHVKFSYWKEVVSLSIKDWLYTLRVLRDISDLVSSGWCPPPSEVGNAICTILVQIALDGLRLIDDDSGDEAMMTEEEFASEQLIRESAAAEALALLRNLASRDVLPLVSIDMLVSSVCRLLSHSEKTISTFIPNDGTKSNDTTLEEERTVQQTFVASNSAELLWILLSTESTCCPTCDSLLSLIDSTGAPENRDAANAGIRVNETASSAVRALSAALWGDPPSIKGIALLRSFWEYVIDLFGKELNISAATSHNHSSISLALEIVLALRRLVDSEMVYGNGDLHPTEWESFINALDVGISPWFDDISGENSEELLEEIDALFIQIQCFLTKVPQVYNGIHPIVDEDAQNAFHIHLLRRCVPRLKAEEAEGLGLAAIKSWACSLGSILPCRSDGKWINHAKDFISEAFAKYEHGAGDCCLYPGGYVHSPLVRLEALQSLLNDHGHSHQHMTDTSSVATSISAVTVSTCMSGSSLPRLSLFTLTRNLRDLHLELINKLLLPLLLAILAPEYQVQDIPSMSTTYAPLCRHVIDSVEPFHHMEAEFLLLKFAARVIGHLFKSRSGDGENRTNFIGILNDVAIKPNIASWTGLNSSDLAERLDSEAFQLKLEAIRQLEFCLHAPFKDLPHTHGTVPQILSTLCEIATHYSTMQNANPMQSHTNSILCLSALIPIGRISCTRNGQGAFEARDKITSSIPDVILSLIGCDGLIDCDQLILDMNQSLPMVLEEESPLRDNGADIAPFVYIKQGQSQHINKPPKEKEAHTNRKFRRQVSLVSAQTIVDIEPVAAAIKSTLCIHKTQDEEIQDAQTSLSPIIRLVCYDIISTFLSHGLSFPNPTEDRKWLEVEAEGIEESVSRSRAVCVLATVLSNTFLSKKPKINVPSSFTIQVIEELVKLVIQRIDNPDVVKNACYGIVALLTAIGKTSKKHVQPELIEAAALTATITPLIQQMCQLLEHQDCWQGSILFPLISVTRSCFCCSLFQSTQALRQQILVACLKLNTLVPWYLQVIIFFMGAEVIDLMSTEENLVLFLTLSSVNKSRIRPLLQDVLRCKILHKRLTCRQTATTNREPLIVHNQLARKMMGILNYKFEAVDGVSAWKCGEALLTLRIGSSSSIYQGWAEVVLRSASCTLRRLVRVDDLSSRNPESRMKFWQMLRAQVKDDISLDARVMDHVSKEIGSPSNAQDEDREELYADARNLMQQFDQVLQNAPEENEADQLMSKSKDSIPSESRESMSSTKCQELSTMRSPVFKMKKLKRSASDGDILYKLIKSQTKSDVSLEDTVRSWMTKTFGKYYNSSNVLQEIKMLGFTNQSVGVTSTDNGSSHAIYSGVLKPCTIGTNLTRALNILDRSTPFQTHRVSLLYGGPLSQKSTHKTANSNVTDGDQFLLASQASTDFWAFAKELGDIVPVRHLSYFSGGLDTSESLCDGKFAIVWFNSKGNTNTDDIPAMVDSMVMFHTVTLMPNKITNRKRHVGNDIVHIIYGLESETLDVDHDRLAISGHFGFVTIYVIPFFDMVKISIHLKEDLDESICSALSHMVGSRVISRKISAETVRTLALEADLICLSMIEEKLGLVLNIEERAMKISEMKRHLKQ